MSGQILSGLPCAATVEPAVPNWGRLVSSSYGTAAWNRRHADEISQTIPSHLVLFSFKPYAKRETRLGGTRIKTASAGSGSCVIVPSGADYWARWHEAKEVAAFSLKHFWLDKIAQEDFDLPSANVSSDGMPIIDRRIAFLGQMLREELRAGNQAMMAGLELDTILTLLGIHLLKHYVISHSRKDLGGLSDRQFGQVRDYMVTHLGDALRLEDIARVVNLSSSQLLRSFHRRAGTSPHQFLTRLRLDQARALIVGGSMSLAEVAIDCGFSSQSHLTAVMHRQDGFTPGTLRR